MEFSKLIDRLLFILAFVGACAWLGIASIGSLTAQPVLFVALYTFAFIAYYLGVRHVMKRQQSRRALVLIFLTGLLFRILAFGGAPSDDIYRYLWEGEVQQYGLNPYVYPPDAPELESLRGSTSYSSLINHKSWTAIYPPVAMLWHRVFGESVQMLKASFLLAEGILLFFLWRLLLLRQIPVERILIYWWSPLPIWAFASEGHHDAIALAFLMMALYGLVNIRNQTGTAIAWTAAVLSKGFALVTWPVFAKRMKVSAWIGSFLFGALVLLPFLNAGPELWRSLAQFGSESHYNDSLHALFSLAAQSVGLTNPLWSRFLSLVAGLGIFMWVMLRVRPDPLLRTAWLMGGLLLVLPTVHQWYFISILPFLCFFPWPGWILLTGTSIFPFLAQLEIFHTGEWVEWHWLKPFEYAPLFIWLCWYAIKKWPIRKSDESWKNPEKSCGVSYS